MATSSKFELSSSSPDRPLYSMQRGSHIAASLDRSSSFRGESMENPVLSSVPNMSRSSSSATHVDITNFFQCLRFDPKVVASEHKAIRQVDFKRNVNMVLGISPEESPSSCSKSKLLPSPPPEEIKRIRAGLRESTVKARERMKIFSEALSVFNKFFPSIPSKKRSRSEGFSNDRSGLVSSDRSVIGPGMGKVGIQGHAISSAFELEQQKSEERSKTLVPNKRTRTSMTDVRMDMRSSPIVRPPVAVDRDKEMVRLANSGAVQGEDRNLNVTVDGWEKAKMKKKRSGIKLDGCPSTTLTKAVDGYRDSKQGMQQRLVSDARSRATHDSHAFRPGVANGAGGVGKSECVSQQTGLGMRLSTPRTDQENGSLVSDRRDRVLNSDKERPNLRVVNKATVRDEYNSASPAVSTKPNTSVRAPRSGSGVASKLSPIVHRTNVPNDWEVSHCTNKPPAGIGANNRKRMTAARSSSPPVAHWAGQRPQKISRTARRTNFMPIISSNDETPALDTISDATNNEISLGFAKRLAGSSPQQVKLKGDPLSSAALSESEESGVAESKSKDKGRKPDEIDQKAGQNVQKVSTLVAPARKNKLVSGEEHGDGVRRQGRTGRGFASTRSLMPVEKAENVGTAKQLRSARLGLDKIESKAGRPPTRKLSDRKSYTRQKHTTLSAAADFRDDGHEELLAAVKAVISSAHVFSSKFWSQMEPFFSLVSDLDIAFLRQQGNFQSNALSPVPATSNADGSINGFGLIGSALEMDPSVERSVQLVSEQLVPRRRDQHEIPLCQRLIASLISDEDCGNASENLNHDSYIVEFELDRELEPGSLNHQPVDNIHFGGHSAYNGCRITVNNELDEIESELNGILGTGWNSNFNPSLDGVLSDKALVCGLACSETQYDSMDINEKLRLEIQSIGLFPEMVPDLAQTEDEGIGEEITRLEESLSEQVSKKKGLLDRLVRSASVRMELQEKEFEQRALDRLVGMAYEKYMACWGPGTSGGKSSSSKFAKHASLAFVKRTLDRCHQFEDSGKSCFSEPLFRGMFLSGLANINTMQQADTGMEGEYSKPYASTHSMEARIPGSMGSQQSPSPFCQNLDNHDPNATDMLLSANLPSEKASGREDIWSNRVKKRELLLDDLGCTIGTSTATLGIAGSLSSSAKGKRSERDRDVLSRNGTTKVGRPALSGAKGERKSKTKPKQKMTQLSVSVNGLLGKMSDQPKPAPSVSKLNDVSTNGSAKEKDGFGLDGLDDPESYDLSHLQLPVMDELGVPDDLGGQGQDLGSWLNIDDDGLQDDDFMGLEIPMDDLSDLNMMV